MGYLYLSLAIVAEVIGTTALQASEGFTRIGPSVVVIVGYGLAFYLLSHVLRYIPMGVTYAIWAGAGIVLIGLAGAVIYKQIPDLPAVIGMGLIVLGVAVINLFSKTVGH
jgi:small multidrug resistance pump